MELDLTGDITKLKKQMFTIKEGVQYKIRIDFVVQREIVHGLKYVQKTYRSIIPGEFIQSNQSFQLKTYSTIPPNETISNVFIFFYRSIIVDKMTHMVGSYPPKPEIQSYTTPFEEAPSGMMTRGTYSVISLFTDDDENEHLKWEWKFEIKEDW